MRYAELHCKTNYSFLVGASHPDELVERAIELDYHALAITDEQSLAGVVRAHAAARPYDFKLLIGAELHFQESDSLVVWARDRRGYGRLSRLLTLGRRRAPKGECWLSWEDFVDHHEGLLAAILPDRSTWRAGVEVSDHWHRFRDLMGSRGYVLAELLDGADDPGWLAHLQTWSRSARLPLVAAGGVLYHEPRRLALQHVLTAIRAGTSVELADGKLLPNAQQYLQESAQRLRQFREWPVAVERTLEIADRCRFSLDELRYEYPEELAPEGLTAMEYLRQLTWEGARQRYEAGIPAKVRGLVEHELDLIEQMRYEAYFLTVWDLVRFARQRHILCQGRGSAANSAVCFCLGVTAVDPETTDVLFERFISKERDEAPDIDIDFEHERREEVLQYLYEKYGRERAGLAATVITYRPRSAVRDVGKALGLSLDRVDALAKLVEGYGAEPKLEEHCRQVGVDPETSRGKWLVELVREILGFPRHLSQHVGGMVMTQGPLCELVPIENAAMEERTVIQWDKDDLEELGILKVDCLCLGMLTAIRKCFQLVQGYEGTHLSLSSIPPGDSQVYDMICAADTMGVFQIESRAQMSMLPRLRPRCYYDLVIEVAIVRPGPIQGNMVHPYLRRRAGEEEVEYPTDEIREVLHKTLGVPIFQEQAMRLAVVAAGFTPGEADQLRRAMGAWRKTGVIEKFRRKLLEGMQSRGLSEEFALQVFQQIRGFGEYGFPESHAASFALLVYVSCWLKHYHCAAFTAALINAQPMGFYAPAQLVDNARRHGVSVHPIDVNYSDWECTLEPPDSSAEFLAGFVHHRDRQLKTAYRLWEDEDGLGGAADGETLRGKVSPGVRGSSRNTSWQFADASRHGEGEAEAMSQASVQRESAGESRGGRRSTRRGGSARGGSSRGGSSRGGSSRGESSRLGGSDGRAPSPALRLGLCLVQGLSREVGERIVRARREGRFRSLSDLTRRTSLSRAMLRSLADADAFGSLENDRRVALWEALAQEKQPLDQPLFASQVDADPVPDGLPPMLPEQQVSEDYRTTGLSLKGHPLGFHRKGLKTLGVVAAGELAGLSDGQWVKVAGLVILRQRPSTAKGITFVTLEDETGTMNLVIRRDVWERFYQVARCCPAWLASGKLESRQGVIHVLVHRIEDFSQQVGPLRARSRDFR